MFDTMMRGGGVTATGSATAVHPPWQTLALELNLTLGVYLLFLDIKEAYDSVLHPILWKRCIDKGISGPFLGALQGVYHVAVSRVDIDGELLDAVALDRGVLQGNPLSPALLNIYLDGAIRSLEEAGERGELLGGAAWRALGLHLPQCDTRGIPLRGGDGMHPQQDSLPCSFFADDGVLLDADRGTMQAMLDYLAERLADLGLIINVGKTKWMLVPPADTTEAEYRTKQEEALAAGGLTVYGKPIQLVDEFEYLGVVVWWRWDWSRAWAQAYDRARKCHFAGLTSGWHRRSGSLATQLTHAHAKVLCHFNYVSAIAGAAGTNYKHSVQHWLKSDTVAQWVLRTIAGRSVNLTALKIEAGVWDQRTRIDMLLLRMWAKFLAMPADAVYVRAMHLSYNTLNAAERDHPVETHALAKDQHQQMWAQHLLAAMDRFEIPRSMVEQSRNILVDVQQVHGVDEWRLVPATFFGAGNFAAAAPAFGCEDGLPAAPSDTDSAPPPLTSSSTPPLRLVIARFITNQRARGEPVELENGVSCWPLPFGATLENARSRWTHALRAASRAALRELGNRCRHVDVHAFLRDKIASSSRLKMWAQTISHSSLQAYWHLDNAQHARCLMRLRLDECPTQDFLLHRPRNGRPDRDEEANARVGDASQRRCLVCDECVDQVAGVHPPDTLEHALLRCQHPTIVRMRDRLRASIAAIAAQAKKDGITELEAPALTPGTVEGDTQLLAIMQLQTSPNALCAMCGDGARPNEEADECAATEPARARALRHRDQLELVPDLRARRATVLWTRAVLAGWLTAVHDCRTKLAPHETLGHQLATRVAAFSKHIFDARAEILARRRRDATSATHGAAPPPPPSLPQSPPPPQSPPLRCSARIAARAASAGAQVAPTDTVVVPADRGRLRPTSVVYLSDAIAAEPPQHFSSPRLPAPPSTAPHTVLDELGYSESVSARRATESLPLCSARIGEHGEAESGWFRCLQNLVSLPLTSRH